MHLHGDRSWSFSSTSLGSPFRHCHLAPTSGGLRIGKHSTQMDEEMKKHFEQFVFVFLLVILVGRFECMFGKIHSK